MELNRHTELIGPHFWGKNYDGFANQKRQKDIMQSCLKINQKYSVINPFFGRIERVDFWPRKDTGFEIPLKSIAQPKNSNRIYEVQPDYAFEVVYI